MNQRTGGIAIKGKTGIIRDNDVSFTPAVAKIVVDYLFPHYVFLSEKPEILDACANDGVLGKALMTNCKGGSLGLHDIKLNKLKIQYTNFGKIKYDIIICNPPWTPVTEPLSIYMKLITLLKPDGVLIFIINNVFCYQGWKRARHLPYQKYYFLPRFVFKGSGKPLLDCGVMIYHKNDDMPFQAAILRPYIDIDPDIAKGKE